MSSTVLHHIDEPADWEIGTPVLIVRGWCLDQAGDTIAAIEAVTPRGTVCAPVGLTRPDVGAAFGNIPGSARSGFCFWLPNRPGELGEAELRAVHRDGHRTPLRTIRAAPCATTAEA